MDKISLINNIENSKEELKKYIKEKDIGKDSLSKIIFSILEGEAKEVQLIINLHYIDGLNIIDISKILNKTENEILNYFQFILFKINLILNKNDDDNNKFSIKNFTRKSNKNLLNKGSLFDEKI